MEGPAVEGALEGLASNGLRDIVVHSGAHALLAVALDGRGRHGDDGDGARGDLVRVVVPDQVGRAVPVDHRHLHVHEDGIGFGVWGVGSVGGDEVVKGFAPVPDCRD